MNLPPITPGEEWRGSLARRLTVDAWRRLCPPRGAGIDVGETTTPLSSAGLQPDFPAADPALHKLQVTVTQLERSPLWVPDWVLDLGGHKVRRSSCSVVCVPLPWYWVRVQLHTRVLRRPLTSLDRRSRRCRSALTPSWTDGLPTYPTRAGLRKHRHRHRICAPAVPWG